MSVNLESLGGNVPFVYSLTRLGNEWSPIPSSPNRSFISGSSPRQAVENVQAVHADTVIVMTGTGSSSFYTQDYNGRPVKVSDKWVKDLSAHGITVIGCHYLKSGSKTETISAARRNSQLGMDGLIWDVETVEDAPGIINNAAPAIKAAHDAFPNLTMGITTWSKFFSSTPEGKQKEIHEIKLAQALMNMEDIEFGIPMVAAINVVKDTTNPNKKNRLDIVPIFQSNLEASLFQWSQYLPPKPLLSWYPFLTGEGHGVMSTDIAPLISTIISQIANYPQLRGASPWNLDFGYRYEQSYSLIKALKQVGHSPFRGSAASSPSNN